MPFKKLQLDNLHPANPLNEVVANINENFDAVLSAIDSASAGNGVVGPKGDKGDTGADGREGPAGKDGKDGKDGEMGPAGPQGPQGVQGEPGKDGKDGLPGEQGPKGDTGAQGIQGLPGRDGTNGATGATGATGPAGPQGVAGPAGKDGVGISNTTVQNTITLGATVTAPTTGTRTVQRIESQTVGDKIRLTYKLGFAAGNQGNGHYLLSLPTGVSFNTTYNPTYNGAAAWTGDTHGQAPNLIVTSGGIIIPGGWNNSIYVVPYDSTRFRLLLTFNGGQTTFNYWDSTYYWAAANTSLNLQFEIWK